MVFLLIIISLKLIMFLEKYPLCVNVANGGTMYEKKSYRDNVFVESARHWTIIRAIAGKNILLRS